jgi:hypothetical protein
MKTGRSSRALVGLVAFELLVVRLLLFGLGYRTTTRVLAVVTPSPSWFVEGDLEPKTLARTVEAVARRLPIKTTCLVEALVCKTILDEWGFDTDLQVGVTKAGDVLEAHAWLVHRGEILVGATREDPTRFRKIADGLEP